MRTTLDIDDDVLAAARSLARIERRSIGAVLSALARSGLRPPVPTKPGTGGFPVFDVAPGGRPITSEKVRAALDDEQ
ncbi:MAG: type II toxin-antitoxin system VapB family antitoxin [Actinomycetota bacterium]|nr:type II toxin-antitoxin system VapB family antitoxin [Actinomycetota bacterium]